MKLENPKNQILYIGKNEADADSLAQILNYRQQEFLLESVSSLSQARNLVQRKNFNACIFDANLVTGTGLDIVDQVLQVTRETPLVVLVDEGRVDLGEYALEKGAFDYLVKMEGTITSIPFTIDRALEYEARKEKVPFDFPVESDLEELTSFFEINESGRFLTCDDHLSDILGIPKQEFYKSYLMDFVADEDREKFYDWRASPKRNSRKFRIQTEIIHREKGIIPVELHLEPYSKPESLFSGFRGYLKIRSSRPKEEAVDETIDLLPFFQNLYQLNSYLRQGYRQLFCMRLTEIPQKYFRFGHASLFLYNSLKDQYKWELSIGESYQGESVDLRSGYFHVSEVKQLFPEQEFVRFVHQSVLSEAEREKIHGSAQAELFQEKAWNPGEEWNVGDRLFINLKDPENSSYGFIILERPESGKIPPTPLYRQAELYSIFVSSLYESDTRMKNVETKYKQFKQIFTILETFHVELPLEGLLKEIVWTLKFALGFNLTALAILSKSTRMLHIKAVAVEGKEKANILSRLHFTLPEISPWLQEKFQISHSYLISDKDSPFHLLKRIYGLPLSINKAEHRWRYEDLLLVPIRLENQKIIGFFLLDDPEDKMHPSLETVQIIEKIGKWIATTVLNKIIYTQMRAKVHGYETGAAKPGEGRTIEVGSNRIKKIFQRMNLQK